MRVLFNALQAGNRSGTGRYCSELVRHLPPVDPHVELHVAWPHGVPCPFQTVPASVEIMDCPIPGQRQRVVWDQWRIPRLARRAGADFIHYPASVGSLAVLTPTVVTVHDVCVLRYPEWFTNGRGAYLRWAIPRTARRARRVIADSQSTKADLIEIARVPEGRIDVVPLGVASHFTRASEQDQRKVRRRYQAPEHFVLYMGTLEPRKNLMRLIKAWGKAAADLPYDLVIAGRLGWKVQRLQKAVTLSPLSDRIHFTGYVADEDQPALLSAAHAFVWPSLYEGFGLPPLEAMACGTPVLTSNTSSLPEVCGEAALLVDPRDDKALNDGIRRICTDSDYRAQLVRRGKARAAEMNWERCAESTVETYRRALES